MGKRSWTESSGVTAPLQAQQQVGAAGLTSFHNPAKMNGKVSVEEFPSQNQVERNLIGCYVKLVWNPNLYASVKGMVPWGHMENT